MLAWLGKLSVQAKIGWTITAIWCASGIIYVLFYYGTCKFFIQPPNLLGDSFAGFFAPLAFLWFVLGYFQQGEELKQNTKALLLQHEELKKTREAVAENEIHTQLNAFLQASQFIFSELLSQSADVDVRTRHHDLTTQERLWRRAESGDRSVFCRDFVVAYANNEVELDGSIGNNQEIITAMREYCIKFDDLQRMADDADRSHMILNTLRMSDWNSFRNLLDRYCRAHRQ